MRTLVTGASGFIGSHLAERLRKDGHEVRAMLRETSSRANLEQALVQGVTLATASLSDPDEIKEVIDGVDVIYHCAGMTAAFDSKPLEEVNAQGTARIFQAIERCTAPPRRVVLVSSLEAAGQCDPNIARREYHAVCPHTRYGISKLHGEQAAYEAAQRGIAEVVIVRPPIVYGPRDKDVFQMFQAARHGLIGQPGLRAAPVSIVHVADLVRGIALAGAEGIPLPVEPDSHVLAGGGLATTMISHEQAHAEGQGIYYFGDGGVHTTTSFCEEMVRAFGRRPITLKIPAAGMWVVGAATEAVGRLRGKVPALNLDKVKTSLGTGWFFDHSKAAMELGYAPEFDVAHGVETTITWLRGAGWLR
jgi:nucleoside-diphosphate-sugar epimerase